MSPATVAGRRRRARHAARWAAAGLLALAGCHAEMYDQPKLKPYSATSFFKDGQSSRPLVVGTVSRNNLRVDSELYAGKTADGKPVETFPFPIDKATIERGRERFNIYCATCHGATGDGRGMIVRRGFPPPQSYHTERLRNETVGHYFDVITNGYGAMYPYAARVAPKDRWAIISYIRTLQYSQNADVAELSPEDRGRVEEAAQ